MKTLFLSALGLALSSVSALAVTRTWDGEGSDDNFSTAANWSGNIAPVNDDSLVFGAAAPTTVNNDLTGRIFDSITFNEGMTLAGNPFTLTGGIISNAPLGIGGRGAVVVAANVTLGANQTFVSGGASSLRFSGSVLFGSRVLTVSGARPTTFEGITGSSTAGSRLILSGTGLVRFSSTSIGVMSLPVLLSGGTLDVDGSLQAPVEMSGGKLTGEGTLIGLTATAGVIEPDANDLQVAGDVTLGGTSQCLFHLTGASAENTLNCTGSLVRIEGSATMNVDTVSYTPAWHEDFQLLTKSTAGSISGRFSNVADDAEIPLGTVVGIAHYDGGNNNDLTLNINSTTHTWDGGNFLNDNWDEAENWEGNDAPQFGDVLVFPTGIQSTDRGVDNNFPVDTTFRQLVFNGDDFTVRGNRFRLSDGMVLAAGDLTTTNLDTSVVLARDQTLSFVNSTRGREATLHLDLLDEIDTAGQTLFLAGNGTVDGNITGSGRITAVAGSHVRLLSATTYTGTTLIEADGELALDRPDLTTKEPTPGTSSGGVRVRGAFRLSNSRSSGRLKVDDAITLEPGAFLFSDCFSLPNPSTNEVAGNLNIEAGAELVSTIKYDGHNGGTHEITGRIQGAGSLLITSSLANSNNAITIAGSTSNTFTGNWAVDTATVNLAKSAANLNAISGAKLTIVGSDAAVQLENNEQISDTCEVRLEGGGQLVLGPHTETIATLSFDGNGTTTARGDFGSLLAIKNSIDSGGGNLVVNTSTVRIEGTPAFISPNGNTTQITFHGNVVPSIGASLMKTGSGFVTFLPSSSVSVPLQIQAGLVLMNGNGSASPVTLNGGNLGGNGSVGAITSQAGGGNVRPGSATDVAVLTSGALNWNASTTFVVKVLSSAPGTGNDQLSVTGTVSLGNAALSVNHLPNFNIPLGAEVIVLLNDGSADAIVGTFAGLPEGAFFPSGIDGWTITYKGGDGNDVALKRSAIPVVLAQLNSVSFSKGTGPNGEDQVTINGTAAPSVIITMEASTNLSSWTPLPAFASSPSGGINIIIDQAPGLPKRFFRVRQ